MRVPKFQGATVRGAKVPGCKRAGAKVRSCDGGVQWCEGNPVPAPSHCRTDTVAPTLSHPRTVAPRTVAAAPSPPRTLAPLWNGPSPADQIHEEQDRGDHEQDVNDATSDIESEAKYPEQQQQDN